MSPFEQAFFDRQKPMLACDWDAKKLCFPQWVQPKIDGVRALNFKGVLTGRSFKRHKNKFTTGFFTHDLTLGMDGELASWSETAPDLCRRTTSAVGTIEGEPYSLWWLFDFIQLDGAELSYCERYARLQDRMATLQVNEPLLWSRLRLVPYKVAYNVDDIEAIDAQYLELGYEGSILRNPYAQYKSGRCTPTESNLSRIKRFSEEEATVTALVEGNMNGNPATVNELGQTERSSHQDNMIPNGQVGALLCKDLKTGQDITVAAGCMTHAERLHYLAHPGEIVGKVIKFKTFAHGKKDKPRFPTFQSLRAESDMS